ncbi:MerR family transcriptional regulator [Actinophytocola algeriensis]|uniref:DNA-binding transcriptional MerR regulator n=1 Tax=Actinophytocola algeriensis TaxID=1768010 RepID=A0A7W7Q8S1_9PSEU|nr:MerR family transcriptional regulator [Actinophytocola algeriensis]MBB4909099.1 DNA-binding transcriptional MerR regulator [Actinophytocola algeriensis]MBE1474513.1 DNA-binding transcriptional MerR regulator [Actinophytocola algeriensis]
MQRYSPGQVAEQTGFSLDTLRYYERIGLLDDIARNSGGQRVFTEGDVAWLRILRCLRDTGMPIQRMVRYAELARGGDETVAERLEVLREHDRDIDEKIAHLRVEQEHIRAKIGYYQRELDARTETVSQA